MRFNLFSLYSNYDTCRIIQQVFNFLNTIAHIQFNQVEWRILFKKALPVCYKILSIANGKSWQRKSNKIPKYPWFCWKGNSLIPFFFYVTENYVEIFL